MITKENILEALKKIQDPELKRDIVSLGMVKEVLVQGGDMTVELTVAASSHTLKDALKAAVEKSLSGLPGAGKVAVRFSALPSAKTPCTDAWRSAILFSERWRSSSETCVSLSSLRAASKRSSEKPSGAAKRASCRAWASIAA